MAGTVAGTCLLVAVFWGVWWLKSRRTNAQPGPGAEGPAPPEAEPLTVMDPASSQVNGGPSRLEANGC